MDWLITQPILTTLLTNLTLTHDPTISRTLIAEHARDFLLAIPIDGLGQHMFLVVYRIILRYRLMIPLFPKDGVCLACLKVCLDTFEEHAVHCRELLGFKYMHDLIRYVLFDIFRRAWISVKKKASVNFLTDHMKEDRHFVQRMFWCIDGYVRNMFVWIWLEFPHCGTGDQSFYCGTGSSQGCFKQNGQT
jgi:hypothetical protein